MPRRRKQEPDKCAVTGCDEEAVKSIPKKKLIKVFGKGNLTISGRRAKLCKTHYKEYKKDRKEDRTIEQLTWK